MRKHLMAVSATLAAAMMLLSCGAASPKTTSSSGCANGSDAHRIEIVVEHSNGKVLDRCVGFNGSGINALKAVQESGIETGAETFGGLGTAFCQVDEQPAHYSQKCFDNGMYWATFISKAGSTWTMTSKGPSSTTLTSGDAYGLRYESQNGSAVPPPRAPQPGK